MLLILSLRLLQICRMMTLGIRECDWLDGVSNLLPWKLRLQMVMEEIESWEHVEKVIVTPTHLTKLATNNKESKAKQIILDSVNVGESSCVRHPQTSRPNK